MQNEAVVGKIVGLRVEGLGVGEVEGLKVEGSVEGFRVGRPKSLF